MLKTATHTPEPEEDFVPFNIISIDLGNKKTGIVVCKVNEDVLEVLDYKFFYFDDQDDFEKKKSFILSTITDFNFLYFIEEAIIENPHTFRTKNKNRKVFPELFQLYDELIKHLNSLNIYTYELNLGLPPSTKFEYKKMHTPIFWRSRLTGLKFADEKDALKEISRLIKNNQIIVPNSLNIDTLDNKAKYTIVDALGMAYVAYYKE